MDKATYSKLYEELSDAIFRYCFFRVYDRERAKEITQEAFMKTWEYASKNNEIDNVRAFIYRVAHNLTVNEVTRKKKMASLETMQEETGFDPGFDGHLSIETASEIRILKEKISSLGEKDAEILIMKYINDLTVSQIAEALGMRENSVSVKLHRAVAKMKKLYEDRAEQGGLYAAEPNL